MCICILPCVSSAWRRPSKRMTVVLHSKEWHISPNGIKKRNESRILRWTDRTRKQNDNTNNVRLNTFLYNHSRMYLWTQTPPPLFFEECPALILSSQKRWLSCLVLLLSPFYGGRQGQVCSNLRKHMQIDETSKLRKHLHQCCKHRNAANTENDTKSSE